MNGRDELKSIQLTWERHDLLHITPSFSLDILRTAETHLESADRLDSFRGDDEKRLVLLEPGERVSHLWIDSNSLEDSKEYEEGNCQSLPKPSFEPLERHGMKKLTIFEGKVQGVVVQTTKSIPLASCKAF